MTASGRDWSGGRLPVDPEKAVLFNEKYQIRLGDTIVFRDDSKTIIESLKGRLRQYVVSNGTVIAQTKKLKLSGLGELMDGIFLSEQMGIEKPNKAFFDKAFAIMNKDHPEEALHPDEILIVGDSLTSDIRGGLNSGIKTCWYNPKKLPVPEGYHIENTPAGICRADGAAEAKEGILTDSFEVAQSRDGLPRSKIGGSSAAACGRRDLELEVTQRGKSWNHSPEEILACGV